MGQTLIVIAIVIGIVVLFVRHYYKVFSGKKSACSCGEQKRSQGACCGCDSFTESENYSQR